MKPLKLIMQAFGPYAEKEVIDFTELGNRTMFVISGKTGAGKTTIFDGISFAIYGKASGEDRTGSDLRSQFAADDLLTEVSLEFSLRDKKYSIWRSPQQEKKKARGEGYTTIGAKAEMYLLKEDGTKEIIASNIREADEKIKEIIQLDANQFRQILMIPQGEFRKLLVSDSKDKEVILQRLFHTELYKKIEDSLREEASILKREVEGKVTERTHVLKGLTSLFNEDLKNALQENELNDSQILILLEKELEEMKNQLETGKAVLESKKRTRDTIKKKLDEADAVVKQLELKDLLQKQKEEMESKKPEIERKKQEIANAYKASILEQQDLLCRRLRKDYDGYAEAFSSAGEKLSRTKAELENAKRVLDKEEEKAGERNQAADQLSALLRLKDDVYSFEERVNELKKTELLYKKLENTITNKKESLLKLEKKAEEHRAFLEKSDSVQKEYYETEKKLENLNKGIKELEKLGDLTEQKKKQAQRVEFKQIDFNKAKSRLEDAKDTLFKMEKNWHAGQAAILAQMLENGEACPVCGSLHHPSPASGPGEQHSEEDLKAARGDVQKLEEERSKAESSLFETQSRLTAIESSVEERISEVRYYFPEFSSEFLEKEHKSASDVKKKTEKHLEDQKRQMAGFEKLDIELKALNQDIKDSRTQLEELQQQEKNHSTAYMERRSAVQFLTQSIPEDLRSRESFDRQVKMLALRKQNLEAAYEAARNLVQEKKEQFSAITASHNQLKELLEKSDKVLKEERQAFVRMMEEQGFSAYQAYSDAKRSPETIRKLEKDVQQYGEEYRSVSDRYAELTERLSGVVRPDVDAIQKELESLEEELNEITKKQTNMQMTLNRNMDIRKRTITINIEIKQSEERYKVIGHLSDIARGQNTYRITFERFVLASFLDDILSVANERLIKMTSGRYQLLRKKDRSKGNSQSGLELLVFDQYTGQERHVKTMSGGESFKASLSLALGLADVVQQHAGGVSLETMFIDEGFGTLDPESLDHAIEALMDIQSSGRLVGVISHVPELKERIDARLEVAATKSGSRTHFEFLA